MAGLQRSSETFRRSGSSGLVWDDRHLSGEIKPPSPAARPRLGATRRRDPSRARATHRLIICTYMQFPI
ncbi:hypothetical protein OsI_20837 [Oryza sativa Indica Group]|uniref:Os05g0542700 protein n=2 Tax=Oryza sativa TaxID=4530 RepID=Q65XN7_ORYSJ|nr:unknown protein [Oryza sativa Japonica Group]EEC79625.1 hypothetical protein OsI_20837 [Oryza sativa Indica Group]BAF18111.1 Os05g0542700 [Oryza sativa Japonica Group]|eukprot:NP_001056197.1 Os05g0542700 [Oryza sativa Japonica Group]